MENSIRDAPVYRGTICGKEILFDGEKMPFGPQLLFVADSMESLVVSAEICEDAWSSVPPSIEAARKGQ